MLAPRQAWGHPWASCLSRSRSSSLTSSPSIWWLPTLATVPRPLAEAACSALLLAVQVVYRPQALSARRYSRMARAAKFALLRAATELSFQPSTCRKVVRLRPNLERLWRRQRPLLRPHCCALYHVSCPLPHPVRRRSIPYFYRIEFKHHAVLVGSSASRKASITKRTTVA